MRNSDTGWESGFSEKSRRFYEQYGAPMIRKKYPEYEGRIAVGIAGEGSECYGFDDNISRDHDYGLSFCMWLTEEDYRKIGASLQRSYEELIGETSPGLQARRGVQTISGFYTRVLRFHVAEETGGFSEREWFVTSDDRFCEAVNGCVFRDDLGIFTRIRRLIMDYYPQKIYLYKLMNALHEFSQNAQSNYGRMMARGDYLTAEICRVQGAKAAMQIAFLLNRTYAPYYKWTAHALREEALLSDLPVNLEKIVTGRLDKEAWILYRYDPTRINSQDRTEQGFETVAALIVQEMKRQRLTFSEETFLEAHIPYVSEQTEGSAPRSTSDI